MGILKLLIEGGVLRDRVRYTFGSTREAESKRESKWAVHVYSVLTRYRGFRRRDFFLNMIYSSWIK